MVVTEDEAIELLRRGRVVAIPTDTVYGVAVAAAIPGATDALFELKERPADVALPVLIRDAESVDRYARFAVDLTSYWPGALTVVGMRTQVSEPWDLGGDGLTLGLRVPDDVGIRRIAACVGPLATTSANKHGEPPCTTAEEVLAALGDAVPVVDGGLRNGVPSTVVDATVKPVRVLRQGDLVID